MNAAPRTVVILAGSVAGYASGDRHVLSITALIKKVIFGLAPQFRSECA
jgi:hypothetical protein